MAARKKTAKSRARKPNALTLLTADHKAVSELFARYEKGKERMSDAQKEKIVAEICQELTVHAAIEEEIFYPAVRAHVDDVEELVDEADVEHGSLKELIAALEQGPSDDHFDAKVKVLGEYVKHHVKEEQGSMFPKVRKSDVDLSALGEQLEARRSELTGAQA